MAAERAAIARACALCGTAALLAGAALALWSQNRAAPSAPRRALLIDLSQSVRARWRDPAATLARLVPADGELVRIAYGAEVVRCGAGELRGLCATLDGSASELDAALETARAALGPSGERSLAILSDGGFTGTDPRPRLAALEREGIGIEWRALPERERAELVLGQARAGELRRGAPVALELPLGLAPCARDPAPRTLSIEVEHAGASARSTQVLAPPAGSAADAQGWVYWPLRLELAPLAEGETRVVFALEGEPTARRELRLVPSGSRPRAALLGPAAGLVELAAGPQWIERSAEQLARELESFDLLLTTDASFAALPREALEAWLRRGGAWIACAAPANFPQDWGVRGPAALLPLEPAGEGLPPRDVILLLDGSGSMVGDPWSTARAALAGLARGAGAGERIHVRIFSGALGPPQPLAPGVPAADAPGGPTGLCDALEALSREPSQRERLVVLLSDGQDRGGKESLVRASALSQKLAAARITLAAIAVGADANLELLRALASPGQELLVCPSLASEPDTRSLEALFARQLGARQWAREQAGLSLDPAARADLAAALAGLAPDQPLARCAALRERPGAEIVVRTGEGAPALALARVGLGWCAAAGFDPAQSAFAPWNTLALFVARPDAGARAALSLRGTHLRVENERAGEAGWTRAELRGPSAKAELALSERAGGLEAELEPGLARGDWTELVLRPSAPDELALAWPRPASPEERLPRPWLEPSERVDRPARLVPEAGGESRLALSLVGAGLLFSFLGAALGFFSRARAPAGTKF